MHIAENFRSWEEKKQWIDFMMVWYEYSNSNQIYPAKRNKIPCKFEFKAFFNTCQAKKKKKKKMKNKSANFLILYAIRILFSKLAQMNEVAETSFKSIFATLVIKMENKIFPMTLLEYWTKYELYYKNQCSKTPLPVQLWLQRSIRKNGKPQNSVGNPLIIVKLECDEPKGWFVSYL